MSIGATSPQLQQRRQDFPMYAGALTLFSLTSSIIYRCSSWQTSYCPHLLTQRHSATQLNINHHHVSARWSHRIQAGQCVKAREERLHLHHLIWEKVSKVYTNKHIFIESYQVLNQTAYYAAGKNPYFLHWQMREARLALWWKVNLSWPQRDWTCTRSKRGKNGWKIGEITPLSFPNLCVLCFESDFKATWGWKSPCCVGGKLLLSLLVTLQYTAHLLEQDKNAKQSEHFGSWCVI